MRKKDVLQVFILDYTIHVQKTTGVRTENRRTQPKKNEEKWKLLSSNYFYYYINRNSDLLLTILLYDLYIKLHRNESQARVGG